jgi:hypothetical protein
VISNEPYNGPPIVIPIIMDVEPVQVSRQFSEVIENQNLYRVDDVEMQEESSNQPQFASPPHFESQSQVENVHGDIEIQDV